LEVILSAGFFYEIDIGWFIQVGN